jgi:hypothetical protein
MTETLRVSGRSEEMESLLSAYRIHDPHSFRSLVLFKKTCNDFYSLLERGVESCPYLGFTHVTRRDLEDIDEIRGEVPKMTILYDWHEETLIVKFMVGVAHGFCTRLLALVFIDVFRARTGDEEAFDPIGSSCFSGAQRLKEGDEAFTPKSRSLEADWPSIVFEVVVSETMIQLQLDARFWLECYGGKTRVVIIVCINRNARSIVIERWQVGPVAN